MDEATALGRVKSPYCAYGSSDQLPLNNFHFLLRINSVHLSNVNIPLGVQRMYLESDLYKGHFN